MVIMSTSDQFKPTIAHRDLNTRNILVQNDLTCVIGDLGYAITTMGSKLIRNGQYEYAEQASLQDVSHVCRLFYLQWNYNLLLALVLPCLYLVILDKL